jgi:hypothetical protein
MNFPGPSREQKCSEESSNQQKVQSIMQGAPKGEGAPEVLSGEQPIQPLFLADHQRVLAGRLSATPVL